MTRQVGVFRDGAELEDAVKRLAEMKERYRRLTPPSGEQPYNYGLIHYLELGYLLDLCELIAKGALRRTESRGAHFRLDYPGRDDRNWLCHTISRWEKVRVATGRFRLPHTAGRGTDGDPELKICRLIRKWTGAILSGISS